MKHSSDILLHFVDRAHRTDPAAQRDTCLSIIRKGFRFTSQNLSFDMSIGGIPMGLTVKAVCFTDIPLRMSEAHVARYGKCAIGVRKSLVKAWGGNPVLYLVDRFSSEATIGDVQKRKSLRGAFGAHVTGLFRALTWDQTAVAREVPDHWVLALNDKQREALRREIGWLLTHTKEMFDLGEDVDAEDDPEARRDRYYMEREWRVCLSALHEQVAAGDAHLVSKDGDDFYLPLRHEDVRVVVVPNERVRSEIAAALVKDGWSASDLPTLITFDDGSTSIHGVN